MMDGFWEDKVADGLLFTYMKLQCDTNRKKTFIIIDANMTRLGDIFYGEKRARTYHPTC